MVTLPCRHNHLNILKLVRDNEGVIWAEVQQRHNGVEVNATLKLGEVWELIPRLASLA